MLVRLAGTRAGVVLKMRSPPTNCSFRVISASDTALVHELTQLGFGTEAGHAIPSSALKETVGDVARALDSSIALVGWLDGEAVAVARLRLDGSRLAVSRMAVVPRARGRGIGRALMREIERMARELGADKVVLTARSQQPDNRPFYARLGYEIVGYTERYGILDMVTHMEKQLPRDP
jgi:GNAT superfamily N-acetyltransferase